MWAADTVKPAHLLMATTLMAVFAIGIESSVYALNPKHEPRPQPAMAAPLEVLHNWDSGWYASIARDGYFFEKNQQSSVAFFPLYPMAIRAVMQTGLNTFVSGELVTLLATFVAVLLFFRWAKRVRPDSAVAATSLLLVYPFSIYLFGIVYSDALYLLCAVSAFVALEEDHPFLAALFGACGTLCRPIAPALIVGLLVRSLERRRSLSQMRIVDLVPALAGLGFLSYLIFLSLQFGDPLAFAHVEGAPGWEHTPGWRTWLKAEWFRVMFPRVAPLVAIRLGAHAFVTIAALTLSILTRKRLGFGYALYCFVAIGIPAVSSKDFQGLGRYAIAAFPLFLTLASFFEQRPRALLALGATFLCAFAYCAVAWGLGGFVA
jgi:hypothetical protein